MHARLRCRLVSPTMSRSFHLYSNWKQDLHGTVLALIGSAKRTIITTSSYEARAFGVKTGMTTWEAKQKCPHIIFVIGDNRKYTHTSSEIVKMMMQFTPLVEVFSIRS
jgi:DNA polymerase-4